MITVTKEIRDSIVSIIADSAEYDASTVQISKNGEVTAKKDQDKTAVYDNARYLVGNIEEMIDANGNRQIGW
ncbi:hypothetical protein FKW50_06900 [Acetobacter pomorum]|uniref:hypothetical protein n=1 Tax=Acetobacter pomorum TaxID=65959 RepID=UPI00126C9694|nr:hypothetical protein [Acetobacter pomorum]KAA8419955.1 hypothetical protein FKW54_14380 [Acetobacter pomorum]KAA8435543.1 hypothetical protein FKW50_06900 [Acetobacter pomorum]KAA8448324.1 hypothetical protein FKW52_13555 [Acetobacter pomorum]